MDSVRKLACSAISNSLNSENVNLNTETLAFGSLQDQDKALFHELEIGTLREWKFLEWTTQRFAKRKASRKLQIVLHLSAYQLLFLDRIPPYAVFSEAKSLGKEFKFSEDEIQFVHAILKKIENEKGEILKTYKEVSSRLANGELPSKDEDWAYLNASASLLDTLTRFDNAKEKKLGRTRAVQALCAMKKRAELVGYRLPLQQPESEFEKLGSQIAPFALKFKSSAKFFNDLSEHRIRVQGEASQWACSVAANELNKLGKVKGKNSLSILELATGKGGKLLGTLTAWTHLLNGDPKLVPAIEWFAIDPSNAQFEKFENDVTPILNKIWPQVKCTHLKEIPENRSTNIFDFAWLDAPCTGFGTLAKLPQIALTRGEKAYEMALELSKTQTELCESAMTSLKPQAKFFYTVCTMTHPETEKIQTHCENKMGRKAELSQTFWPSYEPSPHVEGFFGFLI